MASTVGVPSLYQVPHLEISKPNSKKRSGCLALSLWISLSSLPFVFEELVLSTPLPLLFLFPSPSQPLIQFLVRKLSKALVFPTNSTSTAIALTPPTKIGLPQRLGESLGKRGTTHLFPIQRDVLVPALQGRDIIARVKTGAGKTLAFGIPTIKRLTEQAGDYSAFRSFFLFYFRSHLFRLTFPLDFLIYQVQGAVFDLPEDIAKELLENEVLEGNSLSMITTLPPLQDDGPSSDNYGRFSSRYRMPRGGGGSRGSRFGGRGGSSRGRDSWGGDDDTWWWFQRKF